MSLLSDAQKRSIRDAIRSVTDTFFVSGITYYKGVDSIDRWQENRSDKLYYRIQLQAMREWKADDTKEDVNGDIDLTEITLTFNTEYLQEMNLIDDSKEFKVKFQSEKDFFETKGIFYEVTDVYYDGALDAKDVLVLVKGKMANHITKPKNVVDWYIDSLALFKIDDMTINFRWGSKPYNGVSEMTKNLMVFGGANYQNGVLKYLLGIELSDDDFLNKVTNATMLIERRRRKTSKSDTHSNRHSGYIKPSNKHYAGRVFEFPITGSKMVVDLNNENWFKLSGNTIQSIGEPKNIFINGAFIDLVFRIKYRLNGIDKLSPYLGNLRLTAYRQSENSFIVLSYRIV